MEISQNFVAFSEYMNFKSGQPVNPNHVHFVLKIKLNLIFSSEGDGFSKPAKSSNSKPSKDLLDLDFGNPVAQPPPPQRTGKTETPLKMLFKNDLFQKLNYR